MPSQERRKNILCTGHRPPTRRRPLVDVTDTNWDHTVWKCDPEYADKSRDGLKQKCRVLQRRKKTIQVICSACF